MRGRGPALRLAEAVDLYELFDEVAAFCPDATVKGACLVRGMLARKTRSTTRAILGQDGMTMALGGVRTPSRLGRCRDRFAIGRCRSPHGQVQPRGRNPPLQSLCKQLRRHHEPNAPHSPRRQMLTNSADLG